MNYQISFHRYQLIALWAFAEVALGGMLHAFRMPFTGVLVGGVAVSVITLIGRTSNSPWLEITKATFLVMLVKAGASPHAPLPAYIAVGFQGLMGALIFQIFKSSAFAIIIYTLIAMLESALQKLLLMTFIYGKAIWEAFDVFSQSVLSSFHLQLYGTASQWAVSIYLGIYVFAGLLIGYRLTGFDKRKSYYLNLWKKKEAISFDQFAIKSWGVDKTKHLFWLIYLSIVVGMSMSLALLGEHKHDLFYVVFRSMAAIFLVFWVINPLFNWWIKRKSKSNQFKTEIQLISDQFSQLKFDYSKAVTLVPGSVWCPLKYFRAMEMLIALKLHEPHQSEES